MWRRYAGDEIKNWIEDQGGVEIVLGLSWMDQQDSLCSKANLFASGGGFCRKRKIYAKSRK